MKSEKSRLRQISALSDQIYISNRLSFFNKAKQNILWSKPKQLLYNHKKITFINNFYLVFQKISNCEYWNQIYLLLKKSWKLIVLFVKCLII